MMERNLELYDVTIVGGGPVGLFAAFYSGLRELKTKVIESLPELGGKVRGFFPEKIIRDIGGIPEISGEQLIQNLERQAKTFAPTIVLGQRIVDLEKQKDGTFLLTSINGEQHHTRAVILAIGHGTWEVQKLEVDGAEQYEGHTLHYKVGSLEHFRGKRVLISGGGNTALDWAQQLESIAEKVTIVHRRDQFSGLESSVTNLKRSSVELLTPYVVKQLYGQGTLLEKVMIEHVDTGETTELPVDELIVSHGFHIDLGPIKDWGFDMVDGRIVVNGKMETNIPGIFAIGDIAYYPNKLMLISGGFMEGPTAVNSVKMYLDPNAQPMAMVSTHHQAFVAN
ncbi:thioredoxin reductase (NADPH) [Anoxybacillus calidus]|jgi:ferredoxin/flavodoxin---NADP+ reductase|uniref:Ferredoxin--NADP reductase n=2 Tax=[Anoxybacillus] calidus TaxID=575178 RepID=A0A7W0BU74_9BACL|nr:thioredoxin reductase (NADPH) [Anoxybacillus calidus]